MRARVALAMLAAAAATAAEPAAVARVPDAGHAFAVGLAKAGPRPAGSAAERRAHARVAARFRAAGLEVAADGFRVPGRGRSRNVIGVLGGAGSCLVILMAHADSVPPSRGAEDNASGVGVLVGLAPRLRRLAPRCDVWLAATGAEERPYTRQRDHLGAAALVRRVRRLGRAGDLRLALSLDEVGHGRALWLRSPARAPRRGVETAILRAARGTGVRVRWVPEPGAAAGLSDHREFGLAGLPAAKLGVPSNPCRHAACDGPSRLDPATFAATRRLVERVLASVR